MAPLFVERERAAEGIYIRDEELRFFASRNGLRTLATWAGESIGLEAADIQAYGQRLVDAFVAGTPEDQIMRSVQTDLERAGKPALSTHVGTVLAQAVAQAAETLRHGPAREPGTPPATDPREEWDRHHRNQPHTFGWSL